MIKKSNILAMLEKHVDKIILGVMAVVCLGLLWKFVLSNPYGATVRIGGSSISVKPGTIDEELEEKAKDLKSDLQQPPKRSDYDNDINGVKNIAADYMRKLQAAIPDVPSLAVPFPGVGDTVIVEDRLYAMPAIPALADVMAAELRGAAKVPLDVVTPGMPYESVDSDIEDIDLVTVSARFDLSRLYNNFQLSFNNPGLQNSWRDEELAKPVLARLELQRREQLPNGSFSEWTTVPRAKVDAYKKLLEDLPLNTQQMTFGLDVTMSQFKSPDVQLDILQPQAYQFEISRMDWMPPEFLIETSDIMQRQADQQKRDAIEERRRAREAENRPNTNAIRPGGGRPNQVPDPRREEEALGGGRRPLRPAERTIRDIERDMQKAILRTGTRLNNLSEPVLVWVIDDTVQPGKTYEYRIRMGVFNPVAGKNWFSEDQLALKDQTVLWSDYSAVTDEIKIPKMLHVFPIDTLTVALEDDTKSAKGVQVEVAKYNMGQWRMHEFDVYPGQPIGQLVEETPEEETQLMNDGMERIDPRDPRMALVRDPRTPQAMGIDGAIPADGKVDFSSGMTMVDVVEQVSWEVSLRRSKYYTMLYDNGDKLSQLNVGKSNWPRSVQNAYDEIQNALKESTETATATIDRTRMTATPYDPRRP